jgi:hypothetical protein
MSGSLKAITSSLGYQQITSLSSAQFLTVPIRDANGMSCKPSFALITPLTQGVRWRDDNTAPTAAVGMPLLAGVTLQYDGDLSKIRFIETAASAELNVTYYV